MKAYNKIMSGFTGTVTKLEALENDNIDAKIRIDAKINALAAESYAKKQEAEIAAATATKIRELIGMS